MKTVDEEIKILHINNTDLAGARFNGFALNQLLPSIGIKSQLAVFHRASSDPNTWTIFFKRRYYILNRVIQKIEKLLSIQAVLYFASWRLLIDKRFHWASVVHLHLIHNQFFSLLTLPLMTRLRPTVWTIHDTWAFTGRCIQPLGCELWKNKCGACPDLSTYFPTYQDRSRFMWWLKYFVYKYSKLELIVASQKMLEMVSQSPLLKKFPLHLIPFAVDQEKFRPQDKDAARKRLGVIPGSLVLSFRIHNGAFKGNEYLLEALRTMKIDRPICLVSMDERGRLDEFRGRYQIIEVGWVNDEKILADVYNASDLFLMPSVAEAFGVMALEAMACGVPVIVFEGTALPWVIDAPNAGLSVPARDSKALKTAIELLLDNPELRNSKGEAALALVNARYSLKVYLSQLGVLYRGAIERF